MRVSRLCCLLLLAIAASAYADNDLPFAAFELADNTDFTASADKNLYLLAEAAASAGQTAGNPQRASLDLRWEAPLARQWRAGVSNRFDSDFRHAIKQSKSVNTLREAWLSYRQNSQTLIEMGRINTRYGVALGYNPTDFLGRGTVRSAISADPETLRNNRLGNAMIRLQRFWDRAALSAIWSPKIGDKPSDSSASLDWGASNPRSRLLLSGSYRIAENLNPQLLVLQEEQHSPQFGANLSRVLSRQILVYAEWAGGRQPLAWQETLPEQQRQVRWRNRTAAGITWTGENQLSLRLEGHYNGLADSARALTYLSAAAYSGDVQNGSPVVAEWMAPRRAALAQAYWADIFDNYDLNLIWQRDMQRSKNLGFAEVRRHLGSFDLALQWQKVWRLNSHTRALAQADRRWQLSVGYFF